MASDHSAPENLHSPSGLTQQTPVAASNSAAENAMVLAQQQTELLAALIDLAQQQLAAIEHQRMHDLLEILSRKQTLAQRLGASSQRLRSLHSAAALPTAQRQSLQQQRAALEPQYQRLLELEAASEPLLREFLQQQAACHLSPPVAPRAVAAAYRCQLPAASTGSQLDLR